MNFFLRNNETDFTRWYRHIVPYVLVQLKVYEGDTVRLILHDDEYHELLIIKDQLATMRELLDAKHLDFFEKSILKKNLPAWGDKENWKLYDDIFVCWQKVCFPEGKSRVKDLNAVILGGELKRLRIIRGMNVKQAAEIIGISPKALYAYEEGTREMRASVLYRLCQIYKTTVNEAVDSLNP